ncbi:hypothetical protein [Serinicoccus sp. LYQ131]|uniref:hypothetical protein n=1 Tax=Serinicoccus sp. LYQ131 TaxID=3378797 RepID=UPI0038555D5A
MVNGSRFWTAVRDVVVPAGKAALATGLAFYLGSLLPSPVGDYNYYAALGAFTVVGLFVSQSVKESAQVVAAVVIGVGVAVAVQSVSWASPLMVGASVLVCLLLGALPFLGAQRTWAPLAGLFVLATGGPDPEPMAVAYVVQVPLGAVVGILINLLLLAPLGLDELDRAMARVLKLLPEQMRSEAQRLLVSPDSMESRPSGAGPSPVLADSRSQLRRAIDQVHRARRGNARARLPRYRDDSALTRAEAVSRCAAALEAVSMIVAESATAEGDSGADLRRQAAAVLEQAATTFEFALVPGQDDDNLALSLQEIDILLEQVRATSVGTELDHVLFGALGVTIRQCLDVLESTDLFEHRDPR